MNSIFSFLYSQWQSYFKSYCKDLINKCMKYLLAVFYKYAKLFLLYVKILFLKYITLPSI